MRVAFVNSGNSYLPELHAYKNFLSSRGHAVEILNTIQDIRSFPSSDIIFRFGGFLSKKNTFKLPEIHEYHSASTSSVPKLKNVAKSFLACKPVGRVFLNDFVRQQYCFSDNKPYIYRDMGAPDEFIDFPTPKNKLFDMIYVGSIDERQGVLSCLLELSSRGYKVAVAGRVSDETYKRFNAKKNVTYLGLLAREEICSALAEARFGLNICPDRYPLNIQTSTKVIEYLALGLPIISNDYRWMNFHSYKLGYKYLDLKNLDECIQQHTDDPDAYVLQDRRQLAWSQILVRCNFERFILDCMQ